MINATVICNYYFSFCFNIFQNQTKILLIVVLSINMFIKYCSLVNAAKVNFTTTSEWIILLCSTLLEHICFCAAIYMYVSGQFYRYNIPISSEMNVRTKFYMSIVFPEIGKLIALILQTWDPSPILLFVIASVIISVQYSSLKSVLSVYVPDKSRFSLWVVLAILLRLMCRLCFYSPVNVFAMGVIA